MKKLYKIKKSNIDKRGLYAASNIKKNTKIIEYKGKIITVKETEINPKFDNNKAIYLFNLNKKYDLDGDFKYNTARLINHSCEPNCEVDGVGLKLWIYSIKDIKKMRSLLMIMDLALIKIIETFLVDVEQKSVLVTLSILNQDGE